MKNNLVKILSAITLATTLTFSFSSINNITIAQAEYKEKPRITLTNIKVKLVDDKLYFYAPDFANKTVRYIAYSRPKHMDAGVILFEGKFSSDGQIPKSVYFNKNSSKDDEFIVWIEDETTKYIAKFSYDEILKLLGETETVANPVPSTPVANNSTDNTTNDNKEDKKENLENKTTETKKDDKKENSNTTAVQQTKNLPKTSTVK